MATGPTPIEELPDFVKGEIYLATNMANQKKYVGQTRTHILNHGKFRPFGSHKRWVQHVSEAIGEYKHQSALLNNAIRKYGGESFRVEILETCEVWELNNLEKAYIAEYDTVNREKGYNLTFGGDKEFMTEEGKQKVANTLIEFYKNKKAKKFEGKQVTNITLSLQKSTDMDIVKLYAHVVGQKKPIGADFGGKKCAVKDSANRALALALTLTTRDKITIQPKLQEILNQ